MTDPTFNLEQHRRRRAADLQRRVSYLEGERERYEQLLAILLRMASRTTGIPPLRILDAVIACHGTNPGMAHIQQAAL